MKKRFGKFISLLLVVSLCLSMVTIPAEADTADHVVISQIYGGGGNSGATFTHDFIELYNPTGVDISLEGWSIQYASATGAFNNKTPLTGTISAGKYYLIQEASNNVEVGAPLPVTPDVIGSINLSGTAGKVALVSNTDNVIDSNTTDTIIDDPDVVDYVGFGTTANAYEGAGRAPAPTNNATSVIRISSGNDTDDNSTDFTTVSPPNPRNSSYSEGPADPETKCATPAASPASGTVVSGTAITLACGTAGAGIYYTADDTVPAVTPTVNGIHYTDPIEITGNAGQTVTIQAIAVKEGLEDSDVATFAYIIRDPNVPMNLKEVLALPDDRNNVTVTGQIAYFATAFNNPVLQSVIEGVTYSLYVYGAAPAGAEVGDIVTLTGNFDKSYYGLPELASITASEITGSAPPMDPETLTIAYIKSNYANLIGRYVKIADATLGTFVEGGNTKITDASDSSAGINIYRAVPYQTDVTAGDTADVYAMVAVYNTTVQLYTGTAAANGYNVYDPVNDTKPPRVTLPAIFLSARTGQDYTISLDAADNKGLQSVTITYTIGTTTKTAQTMTKNTETGKYEYTIPGSEIPGTAADIKFRVTAADVTGLITNSNEITVAINDDPQITARTPARNSATGDNKAPEISVTLENAGEAPTVVLTLRKGGDAIVSGQAMTLKTGETAVYAYTPAALADGQYNVTVTVTRADSRSITESWSFTVGEALYPAFFG